MQLNPPRGPQMSTLPQRVLIVDDDRMVAHTLTMIFESRGFETLACHSAEDALLSLQRFRPHLLLSDVHMPGADGLALARELLRELPSCRVLFLTGFYSNLARVVEQSHTMPRKVEVLIKPCPPAELLR